MAKTFDDLHTQSLHALSEFCWVEAMTSAHNDNLELFQAFCRLYNLFAKLWIDLKETELCSDRVASFLFD